MTHEISLIKSDPDIFVFSSLFNLFKEKESDLVKKDRSRLEQWRSEKELSKFSDMETDRFDKSFYSKIMGERYPLLLKNHMERLKLLESGIEHWAGMTKGIVIGDTDAVDETMRKVNHQQLKIQKITSMIRNTLDGGTLEIQKELRKDVDSFFSHRSGSILDNIIEFVRSYSISFDKYEENLISPGFTQTLYAVYHEFRQHLNTYMAESINPGIVGFIKGEEGKILNSLKDIAEPFTVMVADAVHEFNNTVSSMGMETPGEALDSSIDAPDIETIKGMTGLKINPAVAVMRYSARIKTEAVLRFGFYGVLNLVRKLLKKPVQDRKADARLALNDGIRRMKQEAERSIVFHFKNYRENIKFQYIFKLADAVANRYYDILTERFQMYTTELSLLTSLINQRRIDKQQLFTILKEIDDDVRKVSIRINEVKKKLDIP